MTTELNTNQSGTTPAVHLLAFEDEEEEKSGEEMPCLDSISPYLSEEVSSLKTCILDKLCRQCSKSLMGPWADPNNVIIEQIGGGLSNYLYIGRLKKDFSMDNKIPKKVLVRVYGELLRSNMNSVVLDAVIFALLSEKRLGPKIYGVFPGGRIEEFVESRTLTSAELRLPLVRDCMALHLGVLHSLTLPLPKLPTFLFKTMAKFLQQLTGTRELSRRLPTGDSRYDLQNRESDVNNLPDDMLINPPQSLMASALFGSTSSVGSIAEPQAHLLKLVTDWRLVEEFEWLRTTFFSNLDRFPVRFCHNDVQENNILLYKDPSKKGYSRLLCIDYEYCSYNFRGIDIGNFFNEWTYDNSHPHAPGFTYDPTAYPSKRRQLQFWRKYLSVYNYVQSTAIRPGMYIPSRRTHSVSVCQPLNPEELRMLKSIPSAPEFTDTGTSSEAFSQVSSAVTDGLVNIHLQDNQSTAKSSKSEATFKLSELDEIGDAVEVELTEDEEHALIIETTYGALFSHVWWTLWALIQSEICSIDFGFIDYAHSRMKAYYKMKKTLPKSEFEDGELPTFHLPDFVELSCCRKTNGSDNSFYIE